MAQLPEGVDMTTEKEAELERVIQLRGFRYGLHDFYASPDGCSVQGFQFQRNHGPVDAPTGMAQRYRQLYE